jgi:chemotaxis protein methyltransferase CheR
MSHTISEILLSHVSELVATQLGLYFPKERWSDLERGMSSAVDELGFKNLEACVQWLLSTPLTKHQIEILAGHLTVGETYFFRDEKSFEILGKQIFPPLIHARRGTQQHLRIWSAGCSTGEEAYSIAILLDQQISDLQDWNVTILATDVNTHSLRKASDGVYKEWSFRNSPSWLKQRYFQKRKEGSFEVLPQVKKRVTFSYLNLAEDIYPSLLNNTNAMDIIFCRNVLMYFAPERAKKVIQNLHRSLVHGGWLIASPGETSHIPSQQFVTVSMTGTSVYQKEAEWIQPIKSIPDWRVEEVEELHREAIPPQNIGEPEKHEVEPDPYGEALRLYEQGRYELATEKLSASLLRNQDDARTMTLLARIHANQGKLSEALGWCHKAIAADKLNAVSYYLVATILQEQGHVEGAIRSLKRSLYLDQDFVLAHFALGNLALGQRRYKESDKYFENALSLLDRCRPEDILPESEGMTAGRLVEIIQTTAYREATA